MSIEATEAVGKGTVKHCPNCGADYLGPVCPYCGPIIITTEDGLPKGILLLSNITRKQWEDAYAAWQEHVEQGDEDAVMLLFGLLPDSRVQAEYVRIPQD